MAAQLSDDGTLDTVIRCSECGEEQRYNYDASDRDEQDNADRIEEVRTSKPWLADYLLQEIVDEQCYQEFVDWCLEDFESEHECDTK